jgi:hypothetical protein
LWDLRIIEAKNQQDVKTAAAMAIRATEQLLTDSHAVTMAETSEFFKVVAPPESGKTR